MISSFPWSPLTPAKAAPKTIAVLAIQRGDGDVLAVCTVKIGSITVRGIRVRRGRGGSTYINLPSLRVDGVWQPMVQITSAPLLDAVRAVIRQAVGEVTR